VFTFFWIFGVCASVASFQQVSTNAWYDVNIKKKKVVVCDINCDLWVRIHRAVGADIFSVSIIFHYFNFLTD